ncbi:MAG: sugar porter family MFS transporter, partial [Simkania negevensis]|nr:sugar porter family MFS transporter [Simkania negevensis]
RKKIVLSSAILFVFSAGGLAFSSSPLEMILWRFVVGFAIGVSSAMAPIYIAEISPRFMRGSLVSINQLAITIGILSSYLIGLLFVESENWRMMFGLAALPAILQFGVMIFFPESPRWLTSKEKVNEAFATLEKYRGSREDARLEIEHIQKMEKTKAPHFRELFRKGIRLALLAGVGVTIIQQITGINTIIYYAPTIFQFAGFESNKAAILATTLVGTINVLMTFVAIYLVDRVGRKPLLLLGLSGMVLSLIVLGIGFLFPTTGHIIGIVSILSVLTYVASFAYSLGPIGWLLNSEIYPLHIRGRGMGVATCANWASNFIITLTFLNLVELLGKANTFWLYAVVGMLGLLFIWKKVPETKAKSLEEIEDLWKEKEH